MIRPEVLDAMLAAGCTAEQIVAAVKADAAADELRKASKRENNAERQRRFKAKRRAAAITQDNADNALPDVTPSPNDIYSNPHPSEPGLPNGNPSPFSVEDAVSVWNETAGRCGLAKVKTIDDRRRKAIRARLKSDGEEGFREALAAVERSRFLCGENDRNWRADFDFVLQPKSYARLREGAYGDDRKPAASVTQIDPTRRADTLENTAAIYERQGRDQEAVEMRRKAAMLRSGSVSSIGSLVQQIGVR